MKELLAKFKELIEREMIPLSEARVRVQVIVDEFDPTIRVDRNFDLAYPDFIKEPLYGDLEKTGPEEIDITKTELWLHEKQRAGDYATGNEIHDDLIAKGLLDSCFGLRELQSIQARGIGFFRKHFHGKAVVGWRGVARDHGGDLGVPSLVEGDGRVVLRWRWLGSGFSSRGPALRRAS